ALGVLAAARAGVADLVETHAAVARKMRADADTARASVVRARRLYRLDLPVDVIDLQHAAVEAVDGADELLPVVARTDRKVVAEYVRSSGLAVPPLDLGARHRQMDVAD